MQCNPTAMLLAAANMMEQINQVEVATSVRYGVHKTLEEQKVRTQDLGEQARTDQFTREVIKNVKTSNYESLLVVFLF